MKAAILCGGKGTRLSEETRFVPKPLVQIGQIPILTHIVATFFLNGISDFVFLLGYKGDLIQDYWNSYGGDDLRKILRNRDFDTDRDICVEMIMTGEQTMTGGRLLIGRDFLFGEDFFLTYGDGLTSASLINEYAFHKSHGKLATVLAVHPPARFGSMELDGQGRVRTFKEKVQSSHGWINGGYFIFKQEIFKYLDDDQTVLESEPLEKLSAEGELMAFRHGGYWQCMDTLRDKEFLNEQYDSGITPWLSS